MIISRTEYCTERTVRRAGRGRLSQKSNRIPGTVRASWPRPTDLARLSDALDELAIRDPRLAEVVDLKYFCGFTFDDIAAQRGSSLRTVLRDWEKARLILFTGMNEP